MGSKILLLSIFLVSINSCLCETEPLDQNTFPPGFQFGVATASYQVEGAWNVNGKGENIWDHYTHTYPDRIYNESNGDVACNSYYKYKEDVQLIKNLNVSFYRFSLSWSRLLPTGYSTIINPDGVRYYNNLINELLAIGIKPVVTIYHWDLPQPLQDIGGWPNPLLADLYAAYAKVAFVLFGDRVKTWITFNEPKQICKMGYGDGVLAPGITNGGVDDYKCVATVLRGHAKAYRLYQTFFKALQNGIVGFTMDSFWYEPASDSPADIEAANRLYEFYLGIFANPIFGTGDFPQVVKDSVAARSAAQGYRRSRLPTLSPIDVALIKGSADFFGLNFYTALIVADGPAAPLTTVSWDSDARVDFWWDPSWPTASSFWLKVVPWGVRKILVKIKNNYGNIPIYITENGYSDYGELQDYDRANFYLTYLSSCLEAIYQDNVNLVVYTAWSLMDNFEWVHGYVYRFGIHHVNFEDPSRPRTRKLSAEVYTSIATNRRLPPTTLQVPPSTP